MPALSRTPRSGPVSRRVALAGAAAALATGCDLDPRADPAPPAPTTGAPAAPDEDDDLLILDEVRAGVGAALALVEETRRRHPSLRATLRPLLDAQRAHEAELASAGRDSEGRGDPTPAVRGEPAGALAALRMLESRLERRLTDASVRAGSGGFARLLASLGASLGQHLTLLPQGPPT